MTNGSCSWYLLYMRLSEIEIVGPQDFPKSMLEPWLEKSRPRGMIEDRFYVNYIEIGDERGIILTDDHNNIAAYAGFISVMHGKVWQAKNAISFDPYKKQSLVGKIYKMVKEEYHQSVQSDIEQTTDARKLWTRTLPSLGLKPMIFDTKTDRIIDPIDSNISVYSNTEEKHRYCWILEAFDHYPSQNLLKEGSLIMPYKGIWYKG